MRQITSVKCLCRVGLFTFILGILVTQVPLALWGKDPRTITRIATDRKVVALTIDDGPHYKTTPQVLAALKKKQVQATFFILGQNAAENAPLLAQVAADGHEIAVHGYHHKTMTHLTPAQIREEIDLTEKAIQKAVPVKPILFRPPGGDYNNTVLTTVKDKGYTVVLWNIDPKDWTRPPVETVVQTISSQAIPGSIVLLHDGQYPLPTPDALPELIDRLHRQGYEFVTVSDLLRMNEVRPTLLYFD